MVEIDSFSLDEAVVGDGTLFFQTLMGLVVCIPIDTTIEGWHTKVVSRSPKQEKVLPWRRRIHKVVKEHHHLS
jgi:hypothetical protein